MVATGCGGGDGTPVGTTGDGRAVYDPSSTVINLPPGPKFVIRTLIGAPDFGMRGM